MMSTLYNLEPSPTAKVVLRTSSGDLSLELFAKQTPIASRNFIQLCLEGYYDNTIFHRLVPGFIIQGGDPSGTGAGGESSFEGGRPFQDEFHGRLKFNRRGLLGMANGGFKDDNGSQFFLTLDKAEELQNKHTLFGRVEGDTIYNLMRMAEAELTEEHGSNRPMYPTRIIGTEVIVNPFEDVTRTKKLPEISNSEQSKVKRKKKMKRTALKQLLSFEDAEGDETSSLQPAKAHPNLIKSSNVQTLAGKETAKSSTWTEQSKAHVTLQTSVFPPVQSQVIASHTRPHELQTLSIPAEPPQGLAEDQQLEETNAVIEELKASMKRNIPSVRQDKPRTSSALKDIIPPTAMKGRKRKHSAFLPGEIGIEEQRSLDAFNAFRAKLDEADHSTTPSIRAQNSIPQTSGSTKSSEVNDAEDQQLAADGEAALCDLHFVPNCQSCLKWDEEKVADDDYYHDDRNWMSHQLSFKKDRLGKDLEWKRQNELVLEVADPLAKAKYIKEQRQHRS